VTQISPLLKRWVERWDAYWFSETTALRLSICRIVVVAAQLILFFPTLQSQLQHVLPGADFVEPQVLMVAISKVIPRDVFPTHSSLTAIYWATAVAGVTTLIGLFTRSSAFLFALGSWILAAHNYSYGEKHHTEALICVCLMLLAFGPSGECFSIDALFRRWRSHSRGRTLSNRPGKMTTAFWPLRLMQVLLALAYFSAGLCKLVFGGMAWMNGYTLQKYVFDAAVSRELPLGIWLAQQHTLCIVLSVGALLLELFFFVALIVPKTMPFFLIGGMLMHVGIYVTMWADFFQLIVLYVVFFNFERIPVFPWNRQPNDKTERYLASPIVTAKLRGRSQ
jgi:hypothetical protein